MKGAGKEKRRKGSDSERKMERKEKEKSRFNKEKSLFKMFVFNWLLTGRERSETKYSVG